MVFEEWAAEGEGVAPLNVRGLEVLAVFSCGCIVTECRVSLTGAQCPFFHTL